jgi:hypothetical protein
MEVVLRPSEAINVTGVVDHDGPRRVIGGETARLTVNDSFSVARIPPEELAKITQQSATITDDVHDPGNRPNGPMSAEIAPKMPKPAGELEQVVEGDRVVERPVAERGRAEQGGGARSADGTTPGPKPPAEERRIDQTATATDDQGRATTGERAPRTTAKKSAAKARRR